MAGKAITEDEVFVKIQEYKNVSEQTKSKSSKNQTNTKCHPSVTPKEPSPESQQPSTSGIVVKNKSAIFSEGLSESDTDDENPSEKCCICQRIEPSQLKDLPYITFVNWANCDRCPHRVHLKFCIPQRVVRKDTVIVCPHCS